MYPRQPDLKRGISLGMIQNLKKNLEIPQLSLTDIKVRSLKARDRQYKVADGRGLFLVITTNK